MNVATSTRTYQNTMHQCNASTSSEVFKVTGNLFSLFFSTTQLATEGAWRKAKRALGLRLCMHIPAEGDGGVSDRRPASGAGCQSEAACVGIRVGAKHAGGRHGPKVQVGGQAVLQGEAFSTSISEFGFV